MLKYSFAADGKMNKCTAENWRSQDEYDYEDYCGRKNGKRQSKDNCEEFTVMASRRKAEGEKHLLVMVKIVRVKPKRVQLKPKRRRRGLKKKSQLFLKVGKIKKVKSYWDASYVSTLKQENKMATKTKMCMTQIKQLVTQMSTDCKNYEESTQMVQEDNRKLSSKVNHQEQRVEPLDHWEDSGQLFLKSEILEMEQCSEISGRRRKRRVRKKNKRNKNNKRRPKCSSSKKKSRQR